MNRGLSLKSTSGKLPTIHLCVYCGAQVHPGEKVCEDCYLDYLAQYKINEGRD